MFRSLSCSSAFTLVFPFPWQKGPWHRLKLSTEANSMVLTGTSFQFQLYAAENIMKDLSSFYIFLHPGMIYFDCVRILTLKLTFWVSNWARVTVQSTLISVDPLCTVSKNVAQEIIIYNFNPTSAKCHLKTSLAVKRICYFKPFKLHLNLCWAKTGFADCLTMFIGFAPEALCFAWFINHKFVVLLVWPNWYAPPSPSSLT